MWMGLHYQSFIKCNFIENWYYNGLCRFRAARAIELPRPKTSAIAVIKALPQASSSSLFDVVHLKKSGRQRLVIVHER